MAGILITGARTSDLAGTGENPFLDLFPEEYDQAIRDALNKLDDDGKKYVKAKKPKNTSTSYEQDWAAWQRFCYTRTIPYSAVTLGTLVGFVEWLWLQEPDPVNRPGIYTAPNTIARRISGVLVTARDRYTLELPPTIAEPARELLRIKVKEMERAGEQRGYGRAPALLVPHLRAISDACPDDLEGLRDRSLVLTSFSIAAREHEVSFLRNRDMQVTEHGLLVDVRVSKTSPRMAPVPYASRLSVCPVRAWLTYSEARGADPDDYAYGPIHWRSKTPLPGGLSPQAVGDVITRAGHRTDLNITFTGHSPRRGLATEARRAGRDRKAIAAQGGWAPHSSSMETYFEDVDRWEDNALIGVL